MTESPEPPLRLWDLPPELVEKLKTYRYDRIIEKHEGPEDWAWKLRRPDERPSWAPAPVPGQQDDYQPDPAELLRIAGRDVLAVCDRVPGERFYIAHVFHEWFMLDPIG